MSLLDRFPWFAFVAASVVAACSGGEGAKHATGGASGGAGAGGAATTTTTSHSASSGSGATGGGGGMVDCEVLGVPGSCMLTSDCSAMENHAPTPGFCPGPADDQCCTPYGLALCDPAVLAFPNDGNTDEAPGEGGCPAGMIAITTALPAGVPFCIDKYEGSLVRADDGSSWSPYIPPGTTSVIAVSVAGAVPQGYISGEEAAAACMLAGKRLCTEDEWQRACQGPNGYTYPYGDTKQLGVCNDHRDVHPVIEYFGTSASWIWSELDNACINQLPETVDLTGARTGCITAEGAFDMMGNLHEWTADPSGTFRGGYYVDTVINGEGCYYRTPAHPFNHWDYSTGFRCCADL